MGFESFRVELRGGPATYTQADAAVRRLPYVKPDAESIPATGSTYYTVEDGRHVIELEVAERPVKVSCRFTLSHPASVDGAFLHLVRELADRLGMEAWICDDVRPEDAHGFPTAQFDKFAAALSSYVSARRAQWIAAFGPDVVAATTPEVYRRFILPQCEPVTS